MSMDLMAASERVCYVHCNFCNTILAVSVPCNSLQNMVTVRCGHCANLLSVHMGANLQSSTSLPLPPPPPPPPPHHHHHHHHQDPLLKHHLSLSNEDSNKNGGSSSSPSSKCNKFGLAFESMELHDPPRISPVRPPEKRQRVPSAYNRFIKDEIQRIKAGNPDISHREAFSTAAKNWAHFPHIHFGLKLDGIVGSKQPTKLALVDHQPQATTQKTNGLY